VVVTKPAITILFKKIYKLKEIIIYLYQQGANTAIYIGIIDKNKIVAKKYYDF